MIGVVNYGMGNLRSVRNALDHLRIPNFIAADADGVRSATKLILPGVGSFRVAMENIRSRGLVEPLRDAVETRGVPVLGICLGMELFAAWGEEDGGAEGLGWIRGRVRRFAVSDPSVKIPHVGFNTVRTVGHPGLFAGLASDSDFYFVHSYHLVCDRIEDSIGWAEHGERFVAAVSSGHVQGTQFHPEKSQSNGLTILGNFAAA